MCKDLTFQEQPQSLTLLIKNVTNFDDKREDTRRLKKDGNKN